MTKYKKFSIIMAVLFGSLYIGCAHSLKDYTEEYETIKGTIAGPPVLEDGDNRLVLYVKTDKQIEDKFEIVVAVTENEEKEKVLKLITSKLLSAPNEVIFLYGSRVQGPWREYIDGIDFEFIAIGVYNPHSNAYDVILASYGTRAMDALRSVSWGGFIKTLGQAAIKKAL